MKRLSKEEFVKKMTELKVNNEKEKYSWNAKTRTKALRW